MALSIHDIIYEPPVSPRPIVLRELFCEDYPVEVEIGSGKGGFLLERARSHPHRNFLGIEWAGKYFRFAADRMARWGVANVRMVRADAKHFVMNFLPPDSVAGLHVYHPDPWPKKRHHKRRLFDAAFVAAAVRVLHDGACWSIQTDHADYFQVIVTLLSQQSELERTLCAADNGAVPEQPVPTNYQIKYDREGREIHRLTYRRLPRTGTCSSPRGQELQEP